MCHVCSFRLRMQRYQLHPHYNTRLYVGTRSSASHATVFCRVPFVSIFSFLCKSGLLTLLGSHFFFGRLLAINKYYYKITLVEVTAGVYCKLCGDMDNSELPQVVGPLTFMPFIMDVIDSAPLRLRMYHFLLNNIPFSAIMSWQFRVSLLRHFRRALGAHVRNRNAWIRDVW